MATGPRYTWQRLLDAEVVLNEPDAQRVGRRLLAQHTRHGRLLEADGAQSRPGRLAERVGGHQRVRHVTHVRDSQSIRVDDPERSDEAECTSDACYDERCEANAVQG